MGPKIKLTENFARIIIKRIHGNEGNGGNITRAQRGGMQQRRQGRGVGMEEAAKAPRSNIMEGGSSEPCAAWNGERHQKGKIWQFLASFLASVYTNNYLFDKYADLYL